MYLPEVNETKYLALPESPVLVPSDMVAIGDGDGEISPSWVQPGHSLKVLSGLERLTATI